MKNGIKLIFLSLILILIYHTWFSNSILSSGDWHFLFNNSLKKYIPGIWGWDSFYGSGLGGSDIYLLGLNSYYLSGSFIFLSIFHIPWWIVERIMWYWPFLFISIFSSFILSTSFFPKSKFYFLSIFLFLTNTYGLMLIGGGQVGIAIGYSLAPLIIALNLKTIQNFNQLHLWLRYLLPLSLIFGLQVFFDLRTAYITVAAIIIMYIFYFKKEHLVKLLATFILFLLIGGLINSFWILPLLIIKQNPLIQMGGAYTSSGAVQYFSFAKFENSLGLLHPNWPENIFGKVGFMRPEFLVLPFLAFSSLIFIEKQKKTEAFSILSFSVFGLIGAFLAKGANAPFGEIYLWCFYHIPGFIMFRDPTKWYLLVVISYSILIPFTIENVYFFLREKFSKK